jgi:hypothetical protein
MHEAEGASEEPSEMASRFGNGDGLNDGRGDDAHSIFRASEAERRSKSMRRNFVSGAARNFDRKMNEKSTLKLKKQRGRYLSITLCLFLPFSFLIRINLGSSSRE